MKVFITGATGLVGSHFVEAVAVDQKYALFCPSADELDITDSSAVSNYVDQNRPKVIIHFAAHTDLNAAEEQRGDKNGLVWKINVGGTQNLVNAAKTNSCYFIHISTDYVFSGRADDPGPYEEDHLPETEQDRLSWYGWTKVEAEKIVQSYPHTYSMLRITNPSRASYDIKLDYIRKILHAYDSEKKITLFDDQHVTLTYINSVSEVLQKLITSPRKGIYHISSTNLFTPYDLATYLLKKARGIEGVVESSSIADFFKKTGLVNRYVQYGGLKVEKTERELGINFGTWQEIVDKLIAEGVR